MNYSLFGQSETSKPMIGGLSVVYPHVRFGLRPQSVDATQALNLSSAIDI
jgi:hypothetical protein